MARDPLGNLMPKIKPAKLPHHKISMRVKGPMMKPPKSGRGMVGGFTAKPKVERKKRLPVINFPTF